MRLFACVLSSPRRPPSLPASFPPFFLSVHIKDEGDVSTSNVHPGSRRVVTLSFEVVDLCTGHYMYSTELLSAILSSSTNDLRGNLVQLSLRRMPHRGHGSMESTLDVPFAWHKTRHDESHHCDQKFVNSVDNSMCSNPSP